MRRLLLRGFFGPGQRFRWQGQNWEISQVLDRQGTTQGFDAETLVIIQPTTRSPDFEVSGNDLLADFGDEPDVPEGPTLGPPSTRPNTVEEALALTPPQPPSEAGVTQPTPTAGQPGLAGPAEQAGASGRTLEENLAACAAGDLGACGEAQVQQQVLDGGAGGLSFEQQLEVVRAGRRPLEEELALLVPELQAVGAARAQGVSETVAAGLSEALGAIGLAAPQLFLASAQDPAAIQQALVDALREGRGVFPTLERQQLIAQAAQSPTDVVRLLFMAGGRRPPAKRAGAFNVASVLAEGGRAREDLARQIAGLPQITFDELAQRFTPTTAPVGAEHGAIVEMRRGDDGVYQAARGATVVEGPEIFTVGEGGKTEFALLAPGSIIAPKLSPDEDESRETATRAVTEMILFGKRQPAKGNPKAKAKGKAKAAQEGALVPEADQALLSLGNLLQGAGALGASLGGRPRGPSERARDLNLQLFPFPEVSEEQRQEVLNVAARDPNIARILGLTVPEAVRPEESRQLTERFGEQTGFLEDIMARLEEGGGPTALDAQMALQLQGGEFGPAADAILAWTAGNITSEQLRGQLKSLLPTVEGRTQAEDLLRLRQATREGGGAAGTRLPIAEIMAQPAGVRASQIAILGSLFGSDVVANLLDLFQEGRGQAFASGEARLLV